MIDPVAIRLGPLAIHWYAICILSGLLLGLYLATKEAPRKQIRPDDVIDMILWAFPLGIVGARLYYVLFQWSYYRQNPLAILAIWEGGLAIYGGLLTTTVVLIVFSYRRLIKPLDFLDVVAPSVMIGQSIGRWGNFINQEAYGASVASLDYLPKIIREQMFIEGSYRQPTFLYESLWNLLGFVVIVCLRRKPNFLKEGEVTFFYLIWYGLGRFVIEGMRTDSLMFFGLRVSQWLSVVMFILGTVCVISRRRRKDIPYY